MTCAAARCDRRPHAKGYCAMHYQRLRQYGSLERTTDHTHDETERFWRRVQRTDTCWLWKGQTVANGYGVIHVWRGRNTSVRAHRFAYELLVGPIPEGLQVDHLCSVRNCVNPEHLEPVTALENARRAWRRLRAQASAEELAPLKKGAEPFSAPSP